MSFAPFGPLPTPPQNAISGSPILEATTPTSAGWETGGTPGPIPTSAGWKTGGTPGPRAGQETGGTPTPASTAGGTSGAAWQVAAKLLAQIDLDVRGYVQQVFERVLEAVEDDLALPPERRRLAPKPLVEQQQRLSCAQETARRCLQGQPGIDRLLRQAIWGAVDALEAAALLPPGEEYLALLAGQCRQFGLMYGVLKQRAGRASAAAAWIVQGEIRLLRHRGSRLVEQMLFG
jgi:hypothetical protein